MKTFIPLLLLIMVSGLVNCSPKITPSEEEDLASKLLLEVVKSPCYGDCPVYDFRIYSNGIARLDAKNNMNWVGAYQAKISRSRINHMKNLFNNAEFFTLEDQYTSTASDLPSTEIYYKKDSEEKRVKLYGEGPERLKDLISELEKEVDELDWKRMVTEM